MTFSRNRFIINTKRDNTKELTELVQIDAICKNSHLLNGQLDISRKGNPSNKISPGKLTIGFGESIQNKVVVPANQVVESLLIYLSLPYFIKLMQKEEEWSAENKMIQKISFHQKKEVPNRKSFIVTIPLQNIFNDIEKGRTYSPEALF